MPFDKRILIVDDDDAIRALVVTVLRRRGLPTDTARHGLEAVEKLTARRYALVVLDLMMPRMSGYEVIEHLATVPEAARPLVLVLTAGLESRRFAGDFVIGTMQKPFDVELLVDTVAGCLNAVPPHERMDVSRGRPAGDAGPADEPN